ncbi:hypothetical protein B0T10DRAFT_579212 [Thelonectria olida]|uniref:Xylanolytic transcriptional activator regulatory domain-containing protein n=1 Tax=Thelonectria olida TaxID=1576542 RepID=A0A9P8VXX2_9HYPO|nr:hypothetical protein B0T10DRAFT_579212 [Thelonectria olida]
MNPPERLRPSSMHSLTTLISVATVERASSFPIQVRCNRAVPCSNCTTSGLTCPLSGESVIRQDRQDQHFMSQDDRGRLDERLAALEDAVNSLRQQQNVREQTTHSPTHIQHPARSNGHDGHHPGVLPEGESSFGRQAVRASEIAELTCSEASNSPTVMSELASFRGMAQNQEASQTKRQDYTSGQCVDGGKQIELPSSDFVLQLLRRLKDLKGTQCILYTFYSIHDVSQIEELCKRVYFPVEPLSTGEVTLFHGMISTVLNELDFSGESDLNGQDVESCRDICEKNFQAGVETYEVMAIPTHENAMILSLAMVNAQRKAKLPLQWSLTSTAAKHCLTLGYHREDRLASLPPLEGDRIRWLFWHVYISDKDLSSRLGRTSTIQDFDVDTRHGTISNDPGRMPWDRAVNSFIELSRLQGQIYESLYSVAAAKREQTERTSIASHLESQLTHWYDDWTGLRSNRAYAKERFDMVFGPARIIYFSILTLLHRGTTMPMSTHDISPACFNAAQQGLKAHMEYYPRLASSGPQALTSYAGWIFYYTSFTPFVVTFVRCIAKKGSDDLQLLKQVVDSLEHIGPTLEYTERQYNLCKALYRIAEAFLSSSTMTTGNGTGPTSTVYLPLQNPSPSNWPWLDFNMQLSSTATGTENWELPNFDDTSFILGHQM